MGIRDVFDGLIDRCVLIDKDLGELVESQLELGAEVFVVFSQEGNLLFQSH